MNACGRTLDLGEFEPYVVSFEQEAAARGIRIEVNDLIIHPGETGSSVAICVTEPMKTPRIVVGELWYFKSEEKREAVIFHELGHCILGRGHDENRRSDGFAASLMTPEPSGIPFRNEFRREYLDELFLY